MSLALGGILGGGLASRNEKAAPRGDLRYLLRLRKSLQNRAAAAKAGVRDWPMDTNRGHSPRRRPARESATFSCLSQADVLCLFLAISQRRRRRVCLSRSLVASRAAPCADRSAGRPVRNIQAGTPDRRRPRATRVGRQDRRARRRGETRMRAEVRRIRPRRMPYPSEALTAIRIRGLNEALCV